MISVWMTCCDKAQYLEEAIDSILNQTLMPSEILISNDSSTDGTKEILDKYAQAYPDLIKVYHQPVRLGITKNKNFVLSKCKGEYITWLDGDDRFRPRKLEWEMDALRKFPKAKIIFSNIDRIDEDGKFIEPMLRGYMLEEYTTIKSNVGPYITKLYPHILRMNIAMAHQRNELIHRDVVDKIGDEELVYCSMAIGAALGPFGQEAVDAAS